MDLLIKEEIHLPSHFLAKDFEDHIKERLNNRLGGKCRKEGLIVPSSIEIIKRSAPVYDDAQFHGQMKFRVVLKAQVINPAIDEELECKVVNINKMGITCRREYMNILVPHELNPDPAVAEKIKVDDEVKVKVKGKRFKPGDTEIIVIGIIEA